MLFQINGLLISNLQKASEDGTIQVDIIANHLTPDTDGETVLKEAFDKDTVKEFLDIGVIEFWHESKRPNLTKAEKMKNLLGKPIAFRWEDGKPVVTANLTEKHPIVAGMLPHLEAGQPVYAASIGGSKIALDVNDSLGQKHRIIPKIRWDHLAIAPANSVINREPGMNVRLLRKANDILCEFDDFDMFSQNSQNVIGMEQELRKALMAPSSTSDLQSTPGGVLTKQDLEGSTKNKTLNFNEDESLMLLDTILGIKEKRIPADRVNYQKFFKAQNKEDFGGKSFRLIDKFFRLKKSQGAT